MNHILYGLFARAFLFGKKVKFMTEFLVDKKNLNIDSLIGLMGKIANRLSEKVQPDQSLNKDEYVKLAVETLFEEFGKTGRSEREDEYQVAESMLIVLAGRLSAEKHLGGIAESGLRMRIRLEMNELENKE